MRAPRLAAALLTGSVALPSAAAASAPMPSPFPAGALNGMPKASSRIIPSEDIEEGAAKMAGSRRLPRIAADGALPLQTVGEVVLLPVEACAEEPEFTEGAPAP